MATIFTTVDSEISNYEASFTYTMNISFNGIEGSIDSAQVRAFVPDIMEYTLPSVQEPIKKVTEEVIEGGTWIIIDFEAIVNGGVTAAVDFSCKFSLDAQEGDSFTLEPKLFINGELEYEDTAPEVVLTLVPRFIIKNTRILPEVNPVNGSTATYEITLTNIDGDKWGRIDNTIITLELPQGLMFDTDFTVSGEDVSTSPFIDTSADGIIGDIQGQILTFTIPTYKGTEYRILYRIIINGPYSVGQDIPFQTEWSVDGEAKVPGATILTIGEAIYDGKVSVYGPDYTMTNEYINYVFSIENNGNVHLDDVIIEEDLSRRVDYYTFTTGSYHIEAIEEDIDLEYTIEYQTIDGKSGTLGPYNTNTNTRVMVADIGLDEGDAIDILKWNIDRLPIGATAKVSPAIDGRVKEDVELEESIRNNLEISWEEAEGRSSQSYNKSSLVDNFYVLTPSLKRISSGKNVRPGDIIRYQMKMDAISSHLYSPIVAMLLPPQLEYVGNVNMSYSDYFSSQGVSVPPAPEVPSPPIFGPDVKIDFNEAGDTLVKFDYMDGNPFDFKQRATIEIEFDTKVKVGALGNIDVYMLMDTPGDTGIPATNLDVYDDYENIDGSGVIPRNYVRSPKVSNNILLYASAETIKMVKGAFDSEYKQYPEVGTTYQGGSILYELGITNTGNMNLQDIEIVDILPHLEDTGVIETNVSRGSEFVVHNINEISATIEPLLPGQKQPVITKEYSKSYDPVRFGKNFNEIGTDNDWSKEVPSVITDLNSFKIRTDDEDTILYPGQTLHIRTQGVAPAGVEPESIANNSYAAKIGYINNSGKMQYLLPTEPEKIGVEVMEVPSDKSRIGGIVWNDVNQSGIHDESEEGINDIVVVLYDSTGKAVDSTVTAPNISGDSGYYLFNNLEPGIYSVRFLIDTMDNQFSKPVMNNDEGSKVNPRTGFTPFIRLEPETNDFFVNCGLFKVTNETRMERILEANKQAQHMMRSTIYNQMLLEMKLVETTNLF